MNQYLQIMQNTWTEMLTYRLNFVLWRVRMVLQLLVTYFLWWAIFSQQQSLFGYTQSMILTYVLLSNIVRTVVLGTTTMEIGSIINQGDLSNYLVRPLHFFRYYIAKDTADKLLNVAFSIFEIGALIVILRPPIFFQTDPIIVLISCFVLIFAMILYFEMSMILGLLGFWTPDIWAPRFLSFVIMEFFAGSLFPLDILSRPLFLLSQSMPFYYFIYFPIKVYLGQLSGWSLLTGVFIECAWVFVLWYIMQRMWHNGVKIYTAEGK